MSVLRRAWAIVQENRKAYIIINAAYYGLVVLFMIVAFFAQPLQQQLLSLAQPGFNSGPLGVVGAAYNGGKVVQAMGITFLVNLFVGTLAEITIPSLIIPFSGLLMGVIRAVMWGLMLSPAYPALRMAMIPHSLTLLLEGQGYVIGLLAVYVQGRAFLSPASVGVEGYWRGYLEGLKRTGWLYVLVVLLLLAAAIYEALEVILLVPLLV